MHYKEGFLYVLLPSSPPDNIIFSMEACFAYTLNKADPATRVLSCGESTQGLVFDWLLHYTLDATGLSDTEQGHWTDLRNEMVAEMYHFLEMHSYLLETFSIFRRRETTD